MPIDGRGGEAPDDRRHLQHPFRLLTQPVDAGHEHPLQRAGNGDVAHVQGDLRHNATGVRLALGAGGANGLAHVTVLEILDAHGARPKRIAGSSIGAVVPASSSCR